MDTAEGEREMDHFISNFQNAPSIQDKLQLFSERNDVQSFIQENLGRIW